MLRKPLFFQLLLLAVLLTACTPAIQQERPNPAPAAGAATTVGTTKVAELGASPIEPSADGSSSCLVCHEYRENHHPTDFVPADASNFPFPLYKSRVGCLTCHTEDHMGRTFMLRGGPYTDRREICFECHYEEDYRNIYPHLMLDDKGKFEELNGKPVCLVCHASTPDPKIDRTKDVAFRADVAFLCLRCHSLMAKAVLNRHVLLKPSAEMLRYLEQEEQTMKVTIPLVPRERITCSTCHNPHQKGVIIYGPSAKGADEPDRLRLQEPELCTVCHEL